MFTHEQLIFSILKRNPSATHGREFWVAMPVDGDTQVGNAHIIQWTFPSAPAPDTDEIGAMIAADLAEWEAHVAATSNVLGHPLTRRQVRAALASAGLSRTAVPDAIETIVDPLERDLALIDWEDAPYYMRSHPLFNNADLMAALGLNPATIDAMWVAGHALPA